MPAIDPRTDITGLVLAGGNGSRMGGIDKGLQPLRGRPLAAHALARLAPQVASVAVNANRHRETYAGWGVPVWPDADDSRPGPLAGLLAGLSRCATPWLVTVACDTPDFPPDLVARLARAAQDANAPLAMAASPGTGGRPSIEPVFCLLHVGLRQDLEAALRSGTRAVRRWALGHPTALATFDRPGDDPQAFRNANTLDELAALASARERLASKAAAISASEL
jgi:molybdopterin-guanine dinucleotide biosynthesis protein A